MSTITTGTEIVEAVRAIAREAFGLCEAVTQDVSAAVAGQNAVRRADLAAVEGHVRPSLLTPDGVIHGAGFVAAPGLLADSQWWLEWFARGSHGRPERLITDTDPSGEGFYDYTVLPWYTVPQQRGHRHVTGPYVDYVCTEDYTLTFTQPVVVDGRFVGVAGADVRVHVVENALLPLLRRSQRRLVLVNSLGRVAVSSSPRHVSGSLIREPDVAALWAAHSGEGSPLTRIDDLPLGLLDVTP